MHTSFVITYFNIKLFVCSAGQSFVVDSFFHITKCGKELAD